MGLRIMTRRDGAGVRLITRNGNDLTQRFQLAVAAVAALPGRSFLIDGEAIVTDDSGLAVFELVRRARHGGKAVPCAFDLIELDGQDLRQMPIEKRKSTRCKSCCASLIPGLSLTRITSSRARSSSKTPASSAARASCRSGSARHTVRVASLTGSRSRTRPHPR